MSADDKNEKMEVHHVDGIDEHDNPVPRWFQLLFLATIVFGIGYWAYYEIGEGPSSLEEYERARVADEIAQLSRQAGKKELASEEELSRLLANAERKKNGQTAYGTKCASCHGPQGQGGIGPNLTDRYWIHGGSLKQILVSITNGVPEKGMPGWGPLMSAEEAQDLTVYIRSLLGSNPPGAKAPQGELVK
jgi:cytochrome c oxidase cbb3-type subunit 3